MSQSIKSDHISESTIARIAGNLLSGIKLHLGESDEREVVQRAVSRARAITAEVQRTRPSGRGDD